MWRTSAGIKEGTDCSKRTERREYALHSETRVVMLGNLGKEHVIGEKKLGERVLQKPDLEGENRP